MRWAVLIGIIIFDIFLAIYLFGDKIADDSLHVGDFRDDLSLVDYNGVVQDTPNFGGVPMVINSWASWCSFCKEELPAFAQVQKEVTRDNVLFIAINRRESRDIAKKYSDDLGVTNDLIFLLDESDSFYKAIGGFVMPETIFVDKNGEIVFHKRGRMTVEEIRRETHTIIHPEKSEQTQ